MAYSLEEEKEQLNGARGASRTSTEEITLLDTPVLDEFDQKAPHDTSKEHLEGAIGHNHLDVVDFTQESLFNTRQEYNERLEGAIAHSHLAQKEYNGQREEVLLDRVLEPDEFEEDLPPTLRKARSKGGWLTPMLIGAGIGIALAIVGTRLLPTLQSKSASSAAPAKESVAPSLSVTLAPVETSPVVRTLEATGTVAAFDLLPVLPQTSGLQIKQVMAEQGNVVKAGQVLAVLDNSVLQTQFQQAKAQLESSQAVVGQKQAALAQSRATLAQSQRELARYQYLANQGAVNRQDLDTRSTSVATNQQAVGVAIANISAAQADVRNNQAKIQQLQTQLEQTLVRAPANGIVAERNEYARVGYVTSGTQKLFSLIRNGYLELQLKVPETQLPEVRTGAPVTVSSNADSRIRMQGKVREISPLIDQQTRQATVKVDLPPSSYKDFDLRPGMFLRGAIVSNTAQALTVPATAILPDSDGKAIVYLLNKDNTVKALTVEVGVTTRGEGTNAIPAKGNLSKARVEIKSGLKLGDRVVVDGVGYLKDGDRVRVVKGR